MALCDWAAFTYNSIWAEQAILRKTDEVKSQKALHQQQTTVNHVQIKRLHVRVFPAQCFEGNKDAKSIQQQATGFNSQFLSTLLPILHLLKLFRSSTNYHSTCTDRAKEKLTFNNLQKTHPLHKIWGFRIVSEICEILVVFLCFKFSARDYAPRNSCQDYVYFCTSCRLLGFFWNGIAMTVWSSHQRILNRHTTNCTVVCGSYVRTGM